MMRYIHVWILALSLIWSATEANDVSMEFRTMDRTALQRKGKGKGGPKPTPSPTRSPTPAPSRAPTTDSPTASPTETPVAKTVIREDPFASFIALELETTDGDPDDDAIADAIDLLLSTYNEAVESCSDPFGRKMVDATLESVSDRRRRLGRNGSRELQNLNIFLFLRVSGTCNGCGSNPFFFNQVNRRNLADQCEVPPPEDFLGDYNAVVSAGDFDSIVGALSVEDVAKPSGKAKSTSTTSSKKTKSSSSDEVSTSTQGAPSPPTSTVAGVSVSTAAGKGKGGPKPTPSPTRSPTPAPSRAPTTASPTASPTEAPVAQTVIREDPFASFIALELETTDGDPDDDAIAGAIDLLLSTYNEAIDSCSDPFGRKMVDATLESVSDRRRRLGRNGSRELQNLNIFLFLRVSGTCNGCGSNPFFFNQVNRRNLADQCEVPPPEDFLGDYNAVVSAGDFDSIVGAVSVEDVAKPSGKAKSTSKSSTSKSSTSRSSKQTESSSEEEITSEATNLSPSPPPPTVAVAPSGPSSIVTGADVETNSVETFTSFIELQLGTTDGNPDNDDVTEALDLMISTYNDVIQQCNDPADRRMVDAAVESMTDARRKLTFHASRGLQNLNILLFLRVSGACNGCGSNPFFFNQVNRRKLFDKHVSADQCVVPESDTFLAAYSASLDSGDFGSIIDAISIGDVAAPSGKGRSSKSASSKRSSGSSLSSAKGTDSSGMSSAKGSSGGSSGMSSAKGSSGGGSGMSSAKGSSGGSSGMSSAKGSSGGSSGMSSGKGSSGGSSGMSSAKGSGSKGSADVSSAKGSTTGGSGMSSRSKGTSSKMSTKGNSKGIYTKKSNDGPSKSSKKGGRR